MRRAKGVTGARSTKRGPPPTGHMSRNASGIRYAACPIADSSLAKQAARSSMSSRFIDRMRV